MGTPDGCPEKASARTRHPNPRRLWRLETPFAVEYVSGTDTVCPTVGEAGTTVPAVIADVVLTLTVTDPTVAMSPSRLELQPLR